MGRSSFLVGTSWLADHLQDPDVRIVDTRGYERTVEKDCGGHTSIMDTIGLWC